MTRLGSSVEFECSNGGTITILNDTKDLAAIGMVDGWAYYEDLYLNPHADVMLDIGGDHTVTGSIEYINGHSVMTFGLTSREPNGQCDIRAEDLRPASWYRVEFDGSPARTDHGHAHGQTSDSGLIQFNEVYVPE